MRCPYGKCSFKINRVWTCFLLENLVRWWEKVFFFWVTGVTTRNKKDVISSMTLCILVTNLVSSVLSNYKIKACLLLQCYQQKSMHTLELLTDGNTYICWIKTLLSFSFTWVVLLDLSAWWKKMDSANVNKEYIKIDVFYWLTTVRNT